MLRVYVDETGDRGFTAKSSPYFGLCAVAVPEESDCQLRLTIQQLRKDIGLEGRPVHWVEHLRPRHHDRRRHAANLLGTVPATRLIFVLLDKKQVPLSAGIRTDRARMYNYASRLLFERLAFLARDYDGQRHRAIVKVAHVRGHDHDATLRYITERCPPTNSRLPWDLATSKIDVAGTNAFDGLQAADLYCGILNAALTKDRFGNESPEYLLTCAHQLRRSARGQVLNYGIKVLGDDGLVTGQPWWSRL